MFRLLFLVAFLCAPLAALAHEFWIEPQKFQVESDAQVTANFRNGQDFKGINLAYFEHRSVKYETVQNGTATPVIGRMGDIPAFDASGFKDGLLVIVHETDASNLTYSEWEKFQAFADHKDFPDIRTRHEELGFPTDKFVESYRRFAKAMVAVGQGAGADAATGMETEFVALTNPYTDDLSNGMVVQVLYQGMPRTDAQVEVFEKAADETVTITLHRTDDQGQANIPVKAGHSYLFDAVILRPAVDHEKAVWETLWAALTFAVPTR